MTTTTTVRITGKDFKYATAFLKKRGFVFNPSSKTWAGSGDISFLITEGYANVVATILPSIDQILMGMDHEYSTY